MCSVALTGVLALQAGRQWVQRSAREDQEEVEELEAYRVALDVEPVTVSDQLVVVEAGEGSMPESRTYLFSRSWIPVTLRCA